MTVPSLLELSAIPYPRNLTPFLVLPSKSAYVFPFPHFSNSSFPFLLLHQPTRILVYIYLMPSPSLVPKHSNTSSFWSLAVCKLEVVSCPDPHLLQGKGYWFWMNVVTYLHDIGLFHWLTRMLGWHCTISLACPKSRLLTQHNQEIAQCCRCFVQRNNIEFQTDQSHLAKPSGLLKAIGEFIFLHFVDHQPEIYSISNNY